MGKNYDDHEPVGARASVKVYRKEAQVLLRALRRAMAHDGAHIRVPLLNKLSKLGTGHEWGYTPPKVAVRQVYGVKEDRDLWFRVTKNGRIMARIPGRLVHGNLFSLKSSANRVARNLNDREAK